MNELKVEENPNRLVPALAGLDTLLSKPWTDGIQINELKPFDKLLIETLHHEYEMTVINPDTAEVLVRGGEFFTEATPARVAGASLRSSFLKLRGIYVGFNIELCTESRRITTSRVKNIRLIKTRGQDVLQALAACCREFSTAGAV